ncbi:hypothetical protein B0A48_05245 [Cryoendolithus antarcticus]|uniref:Pinin/SDK/MemA protein domain-containing protein n=1 Tax=Cryoendolithus antarcticus TaxID=1507870 RepID=A0A1V8THZ5_9PEZI|nr:hypothetical protein B0A48_05245 [Cryoendolithus antarcticus]
MATELATEIPASNGLKRKQSPSPDPELDHKRARTEDPAPSSPSVHSQPPAESQAPTNGHDAPTSTSPPADPSPQPQGPLRRRPTAPIDPKAKAKRLFGGLLAPTARPSSSDDRTSRRRAEIDARKKAEQEKADAERAERDAELAERLREHRVGVRRRLESEEGEEGSGREKVLAAFLRTKTEPGIYWRAWEWRENEVEVVRRQKREAGVEDDEEDEEIAGDGEREAVEGNGPVGEDVSMVNGNADNAAETTNGDVPAKSRADTSDRAPAGDDDAAARNGAEVVSDTTGAAAAAAQDIQGEDTERGAAPAEKLANENDHESKDVTKVTPEDEAAVPNEAGSIEPRNAASLEVTAPAQPAAEAEDPGEPDDEHMVEGDEDTVIY